MDPRLAPQVSWVFSRSLRESYRNTNLHIVRFLKKFIIAVFIIICYQGMKVLEPDQTTIQVGREQSDRIGALFTS